MFGLLNYPGTLFVYLGMTLCSVQLARYAQRCKEAHKEQSAAIAVFFIIVILSLVCGCRGRYVGIDTDRYLFIFERGWIRSRAQREFVFYFLSFTVKDIFNSTQATLIFWAFITHGLIVLRIWDFNKDINEGFAMFLYCGLFYLMSFNAIRQWAAVAIVFYGTRYLFEKQKPIVFFVLMIISSFIHLSVVISLIYLIFFMIDRSNGGWRKIILIIFVPIVFFVVTYSGWTFDVVERYSGMLTNEDTQSFSFGLQMPAMLLSLLFIQLGVNVKFGRFNSNKDDNKYLCSDYQPLIIGKKYFNNLKTFELFNLGLQSLGYFIRYTARIRWCFLVFCPVLYGFIFHKSNIGKFTASKILVTIIIIYSFLSSSGSQLAPYYPFWFMP